MARQIDQQRLRRRRRDIEPGERVVPPRQPHLRDDGFARAGDQLAQPAIERQQRRQRAPRLRRRIADHQRPLGFARIGYRAVYHDVSAGLIMSLP